MISNHVEVVRVCTGVIYYGFTLRQSIPPYGILQFVAIITSWHNKNKTNKKKQKTNKLIVFPWANCSLSKPMPIAAGYNPKFLIVIFYYDRT